MFDRILAILSFLLIGSVYGQINQNLVFRKSFDLPFTIMGLHKGSEYNLWLGNSWDWSQSPTKHKTELDISFGGLTDFKILIPDTLCEYKWQSRLFSVDDDTYIVGTEKCPRFKPVDYLYKINSEGEFEWRLELNSELENDTTFVFYSDIFIKEDSLRIIANEHRIFAKQMAFLSVDLENREYSEKVIPLISKPFFPNSFYVADFTSDTIILEKSERLYSINFSTQEFIKFIDIGSKSSYSFNQNSLYLPFINVEGLYKTNSNIDVYGTVEYLAQDGSVYEQETLPVIKRYNKNLELIDSLVLIDFSIAKDYIQNELVDTFSWNNAFYLASGINLWNIDHRYLDIRGNQLLLQEVDDLEIKSEHWVKIDTSFYPVETMLDEEILYVSGCFWNNEDYWNIDQVDTCEPAILAFHMPTITSVSDFSMVEEVEPSINIYPNPSTDSNVSVLFPQDFSNDKWLEVYDVNGNLVYSSKVNNNFTKLETKQWLPGTYVLKYTSEKFSISKPMILQ